ncbi:MAG: PEP-utilizing enzyme [Solirubrobacteraceae bacterium]|nr:PEP-utilizing enzyme [Solirubrobacteraceae bacterium]
MRHPLSTPKWTLPEGTTLSRMTREALLRTIEANAAKLDGEWSDAVNRGTLDLLSADDAQRISEDVFTRFQEIEGRRFFAGCEIAARERPDLYVLRSEAQPLEERTDWPEGVVADGDNVFEHEDVTGRVLVVREVSEVDRLMREGVPEGTIGVIDDAGGTMTAPILEEFDAVLCLAGTVRSHLGIIAREFGVPVLMGVRLARPLEDGEEVTVAYSTEAQNVDAYYGEEAKPRAEVRITGGRSA